jgi:hypothetical protein
MIHHGDTEGTEYLASLVLANATEIVILSGSARYLA